MTEHIRHLLDLNDQFILCFYVSTLDLFPGRHANKVQTHDRAKLPVDHPFMVSRVNLCADFGDLNKTFIDFGTCLLKVDSACRNIRPTRSI
jgi:hypothetical protein